MDSRVNKPLLVLPPSPPRWPLIENLLADEPAGRMSDLKARLCEPPAEAQDALALQPDGAHARAFACLRRKHDVGVLSQLFTHADHRRHGHARRLVQTLLSWFDMTGGKWLYATSPEELHAAFFEHFGFRVLHQGGAPAGMMTLLRTPAGVPGDSLSHEGGAVTVRELGRSDWPLIVALLQHRPGPDPRVPIAESALAAEVTAFDLLEHADKGVCSLLGAGDGRRLVGVASLATDQLGSRTYAMILPHGSAPAELRAAVLELAARKGYQHVDFPLEAVTGPSATGGASPATS